jgi:16S rRNA (guanine966-N2)-methyltransferase
MLAQRSCLLAGDGMVYSETASDEALPALPAAWSLHREKFAGGVAYRLYRAGPG